MIPFKAGKPPPLQVGHINDLSRNSFKIEDKTNCLSFIMSATKCSNILNVKVARNERAELRLPHAGHIND